ncbi:Plasmodium variant antigen protein Cir/Yir/Bir, putative, partial [Plasmodium chabaudi chabaudi]
MSEEVCEGIKKVDDGLQEDIKSTGVSSEDILYIDYCPKKNGQKRQCETNSEKISAGVLWLLSTFENIRDEQVSENEKNQYAEYAILFLSSKIYKILNKESITLKDFYAKHIKNNKGNTTFNDHIKNKINSMTIDIKDISKFYEALQFLCKMYNENDDESPNCEQYSKDVDDFVKIFKELNDDSNVTKDSLYYKIWSTLSTDYDHFKKYYAEKCRDCSNIPDLPSIKTSQNSLESSGLTSMQSSEVTSQNSSIASKLIPTLLIFAILILLGIAYK